MSDEVRTEFIAALEKVSADKAIRALVLTGAGTGFCAGGVISGMERHSPDEGEAPRGEVGFNGCAPSAACSLHASRCCHDAPAGHRCRA